MSKKGQLMFFVIIGVLIVLGGVLVVINVKNYQEESKVNFPVEHQPVVNFGQECLRQTSEEGLRLIGEHGGYTEDPETSASPTDSDAVDFSGAGVVYWSYLKSENTCKTCEFSSKKPFLYKSKGSPSIEAELDNYIKENLPRCINNFDSLKQQGFILSTGGEIVPNSKVTENTVRVDLKFPVRSEKGSAALIQDYRIDLPVNLKRLYDLADNMTIQAENEKFLEHFTMNLISGFSGTTEKNLPSISETTFEPGKGTIWLEKEVEKKVKDILSNYVQGVTVENSLSYKSRPSLTTPYSQKIYDNMIIPSSKVGSPEGLDVDFDYLEWPIYFYLGCKGACRPESINSNLGMIFNLQRYSFVYDVSYPVVVTINDPKAFNDRGYSFRFALESNVRNNKALEGKSNASNYKTGYNYALQSISSDSSQLCDIDKRTSGVVEVSAKDSSGNPINDAVISFSCGEETCNIGATNDSGKLNSRFPVCLNGELSIIKKNHIAKRKVISTLIDKNINVDFEAPRLVKKNITAFKKILSKSDQGWFLNNGRVHLDSDQQLVLSFKKIHSSDEEDYETAGIIIGSNNEEITLAPGDYEVSGNLLESKSLTVPSEKRCYCTAPVVCNKECYYTPHFNLPANFTDGGFSLDQNSGYWKITSEELNENNRIEFVALSYDLKNVPPENRKIEDVQIISNIQEYSIIYRPLLEPEFGEIN